MKVGVTWVRPDPLTVLLSCDRDEENQIRLLTPYLYDSRKTKTSRKVE